MRPAAFLSEYLSVSGLNFGAFVPGLAAPTVTLFIVVSAPTWVFEEALIDWDACMPDITLVGRSIPPQITM